MPLRIKDSHISQSGSLLKHLVCLSHCVRQWLKTAGPPLTFSLPWQAIAQFSLRLRYLTSAAPITLSPDQTNVMAYGFEGDSSGHRDVRTLVPASVRQLAQQIRNARLPAPREGDAAILEWPSVESAYEFRLSFLQRGTQLFQEAQTFLNTAFESGTTGWRGACWLPYNLAPAW